MSDHEPDVTVVGTYCGNCEGFTYDDEVGQCDECGEWK